MANSFSPLFIPWYHKTQYACFCHLLKISDLYKSVRQDLDTWMCVLFYHYGLAAQHSLYAFYLKPWYFPASLALHQNSMGRWQAQQRIIMSKETYKIQDQFHPQAKTACSLQINHFVSCCVMQQGDTASRGHGFSSEPYWSCPNLSSPLPWQNMRVTFHSSSGWRLWLSRLPNNMLFNKCLREKGEGGKGGGGNTCKIHGEIVNRKRDEERSNKSDKRTV